MKYHLEIWGMCRTYKNWIYHSESLILEVIVVDDVEPINEMVDVILDGMEKSSGVRDEFEDLLDEVQSELYPGCTKFFSLDFLAKLMNIKVKNKWTNSSFDELLELLQSSHPEGKKNSIYSLCSQEDIKKD